MANTNPETLQDIQDEINTLVANDADTPDTDDDEWDTRLNLIYTAIRIWGNSKDIYWEELWTTYSSGVTTISGSTTYALADLTDFRFPSKKLRLLLSGQTQHVTIVKASEADKYDGQRVAYITGSQKAGFTLNLCWDPVSGDGTYGATFAFDYYKFPFKPEAVGDKFEMSDPNFIVFWVAAQKSLLESQNNKYSVYDAQATESMENMAIMNDLYGSGRVEDNDNDDGAVLGE